MYESQSHLIIVPKICKFEFVLASILKYKLSIPTRKIMWVLAQIKKLFIEEVDFSKDRKKGEKKHFTTCEK